MKKSKSDHRKKVFISYSHIDEKWLDRLRPHLKQLEQDHAIEYWEDAKIRPGATWRADIEEALQSAKVAVLLVSVDFLASEFISHNELPQLLMAADQGEVTLLSVIVRPCRYERLSQYQIVNPTPKTLVDMSKGERDRLFVRLSEMIEVVLSAGQPQSTSTDEPTERQAARRKGQEEPPQRVSEGWKETKTTKETLATALKSAAPPKTKPAPHVQELITSAGTAMKSHIGLAARTLKAHDERVNCVAFSPDGATLASGAGGEMFYSDEDARLWRVTDGKRLRTLKGHTQRVTSMAFSPDGETVASASFDKTIRLWRVSNGRPLGILGGHVEGVNSIAFSPDGVTLASGSNDKTVRLWRAADGEPLARLEGHVDWVNSVAFSPDGAMLATGSGTPYFAGTGDNTVRLWRVSDAKLIREIKRHTNVVWSVAFSPDGSILASGSRDNTVCLWRVSDGTHLQTLRGVVDQASSIAFSPDGTILASGWGSDFWSSDNSVRLWRVPDGELLSKLEGHEKAVSSVAFSPDGAMLASASLDKTVRLWSVK